ncbi:MAG: DUF4920 domain-containing protein [Solirubrobacterales bacterium]|nr:DUF4920 domain-containing protein [Solirubrobacterales bacterium]
MIGCSKEDGASTAAAVSPATERVSAVTPAAGPSPATAPASSSSVVPAGFKVFGGKIDDSAPIVEAAKLFANPDDYNGKTVRLTGTASGVCENRGCWLMVTKDNDSIRARFVESGDCTEGFFVPRDAGGHNVILQGTVKKETISEARARHFAEESSMPETETLKIVGPQNVLSIICTAVAIEGGDKLSEPLKAGGEGG